MSSRNFDALFDPKGIVLVGASNAPHSVGRVLAENLLGGGFSGPVLTVNRHEAAILSTLNYRSVAELPVAVDLAVLATPAATVPGLIAELGQRGCRAAIVIGTGFGGSIDAETIRQQMLDAARPHLMRIIGPNCLGFISPHKGINASFAHVTPRPGTLALVSQSGAIVTAMLDWADERAIGFSHVISLGDMSDVDFGDMLDTLSGDPATRAILLYVENVTHARKFMSAARAAARTKPVLVVKSGRSTAGARAALSHTGALAGSDAVYDAAFRRAGLLRVTALDELFAAAAILATGMRVAGDRMTILTNGGGAGVLAVDALMAQGGRLAVLSPEAIARLDAGLPPSWSRANPIDIIGDATAERYAAALEVVMAERDSDAILVINCPTAIADGQDAAQAVVAAVGRSRSVPVLANWLGGTAAAPARALLRSNNVPAFSTPEAAVRAFTHLVEFRRNQTLLLETPSAGVSIPDATVAAARALLASVAGEGRRVLTEIEAKELLSLFGIQTVRTLIAATPFEAAQLFETLGGLVALKILSSDITHKSDVGGVVLNLTSAEAVEAAATAMLVSVANVAPDARITGFTIQPMVARPNALELIMGIARDATFGPVLIFGRGGKATELIADRAIGLPPLSSVLAIDMIERTRISRLLAGFRDVPAVPRAKLVDVLLRLSELVILLPEVRELDINPILADASGVIAVDARVVIDTSASPDGLLSISPYPRSLEDEITLADGARFTLRPIRPEDETPLVEMVAQCSPKDVRLRFLGQLKVFPHDMAARLSQIDYDREMALVATELDAPYGSEPIFGVVRLIGDPEHDKAEFAVLVRSDMKGRGLGYRLMMEIIAHARRAGFNELYGDVLRENTTMLAMATELGFHVNTDASEFDTARIVITLT